MIFLKDLLFCVLALFLSASTQTPITTQTTANATTIENATTTAATTTTAPATCSPHEWRCTDGRCVERDLKCNGAFNCEDGSDETLKNCKDKERQMLAIAMHCSSPWCNQFSGVCPDICCHQPEYCYYALYAEGTTRTCLLPDFPNKGNYSIQVNEKWDGTRDAVLVDFYLKFDCDYGTVLSGDEEVHCLKGNWNESFPFCSEACKLIRIPNYQYTCVKKNKTFPCADYVAVDSWVSVERDESERTDAHIYCNSTYKFNITTKCASDLETLQNDFRTKTMRDIEHFESRFTKSDNRSFEFQQLVEQYYDFDKYVRGNSSELKRKTGECSIYLDLLEYEYNITKDISNTMLL